MELNCPLFSESPTNIILLPRILSNAREASNLLKFRLKPHKSSELFFTLSSLLTWGGSSREAAISNAGSHGQDARALDTSAAVECTDILLPCKADKRPPRKPTCRRTSRSFPPVRDPLPLNVEGERQKLVGLERERTFADYCYLTFFEEGEVAEAEDGNEDEDGGVDGEREGRRLHRWLFGRL